MAQTESLPEPENGQVLKAQGEVGFSNGQPAPRSGRSLWQGVRTAVQLSNAFQTLRSMSAESVIDPAQLTTIKRLGEGAFATVDLCWYSPPHGAPKQQVAVKRMKPEIFSQPPDLDAFIREADLLRKIRHSHIVEYIGVGAMDISTPDSVQASTYLVQEYLAAGTLKRMVFERQLATKRSSAYRLVDALRWSTQVARALRYLHNAKPMIIHRDLKLENILLHGPSAATMVAKVADFGLCACVDTWLSNRRALESDNLALAGSLKFINSAGDTPEAGAPVQPVAVDHPATVTEAVDSGEDEGEGVGDPLPSPFMGNPPEGSGEGGNGSATQDHQPPPDTAAEPVLPLQQSEPLPLKPVQSGAPVQRPSSLKRMLTGLRDSRKQAAQQDKRRGSQTFRLSGHTGSLLYMAPEVYQMLQYNHKVDVFSFGVVMLELFSGRVLGTVVAANGWFSEIDDYSRRVATEAYRAPIPAGVPPPVAQLIERCWAQAADERPDMDEVVRVLQEIEASGVVQAADAAEPAALCGCLG